MIQLLSSLYAYLNCLEFLEVPEAEASRKYIDQLFSSIFTYLN